MSHIYDDKKYIKIVKHILKDKMFLKLKNMSHHGVSRFCHSIKVSYYSYKIAKFLRLDYKKVATGGLLHDFFLTDEGINFKDKIILSFTHSDVAAKNATKRFNISAMEKNIIESHMFPASLKAPRCLESWLVNFVDDVVALGEHLVTFGYRVKLSVNLLILVFLNLLR